MPSQGQAKQEKDAQSPSTSRKDSSAKGDTSGDQSGGGQKGGGQRSNQSGAGAAGSHTAAEEGGGASSEKGDGQTGQRRGDQVQSKSPAGEGVKQQGSSNRSGSPGERGKASPGGQASSPQSGERGGQVAGNPTSGGQSGGVDTKGTPPKSEAAPADDPDLRYANKQTDLTLRHVHEELAKAKPNAELLKQLGWTRDDLERFYRRWMDMKRAAQDEGPAGPAQKKLNQALKSLGLRPLSTQLKGETKPGDQLRNLRESLRAEPPPEWREQLKAYTEGVSGKR
jgi:hypothetical protein